MSVSHHPAFELIKEKKIESLNVHYQEFKHKKTGAIHLHLASESEENVFMAAFRTVPENSTGVAHILEHTALCGSEKYAVNDPFMSMVSRSLNTFMNAFTSSDWTAYPFASLNKKDFNNLLNVYLDAVFFPTLDPLAFAQEGHRLEFAEANNPDSELLFKGVVFNEMKGALSADSAQLSQAIEHHLYQTVTNHYNSGGDPENITDLTYDEFKAFYESHYHPSNAMLFTFGDIDAITHQAEFEELALKRFSKSDIKIEVANEVRYTEPQYRETYYPVAANNSVEDKTYIAISWLLGESANIEESIKTQLLVKLLMGNSAAPLRKALEASGLGKSLLPLSPLSYAAKETSFTVGLSGSNPENVKAIEQLVLSTLEEIAENGLPQSMIDACLHQFELNKREVGGGQYPYGLELMLDALMVMNHYGDGLKALDFDPVLAKLQQDVKDPAYIKNLVNNLLLNNPHRVCLMFKPSTTLAEEKVAAEKNKLAEIKAGLNDQDKQRILDNMANLKARQEQDVNRDVLPKVTKQDIPSKLKHCTPVFENKNNLPITCYEAGTNGLVYQEVFIDMPTLNKDEVALMPIYTSMVSNLGIGEDSYLDIQLKKSSVLGDFSCSAIFKADINDVNNIHAKLIFSASGLNRNQQEMTKFLQNAIEKIRFDETKRIGELVQIMRNNLMRQLVQNGHKMAMMAAASSISAAGYLTESQSGFSFVKSISELEQKIGKADVVIELSKQLQQLHNKILSCSREVLVVGENANLEQFSKVVDEHITTPNIEQQNAFSMAFESKKQNIAWVTNTQVNFCSKAYPSVSFTHEDAAKLTVLGNVLKHNFLHRVIREQGGAYGGGAVQDNTTGSFKFFSYRDPRLSETLADFDKASDWLQQADITDSMIEEAILGVIANMDKPLSPAGQVSAAFEQMLTGESLEAREKFRSQVLTVNKEDLKHVGRKYLDPNKASISVLTNSDGAEQLGFTTIEL